MSAKKTTLRILSSLKSIIDDDCSCPICSQPCTDTLMNLACGHRFCGKCIKAEGEQGNRNCPTCGVQIAAFQSCRADLHFDHILEKVVTELVIPLENLLSNEIRPQKGQTAGSAVKVVAAQQKLDEVGAQIQAIAAVGRTQRDLSPQEQYFQKRIQDLMTFKAKFGHCNVTVSKSAANKPYKSLGHWCEKVRRSQRLIKEGKPAIRKLSKDQIEILDALGFHWNIKTITSDKHIEQLRAFKAKFGHCNVTTSRSASNKPYSSLGQWCCKIRHSRGLIAEGKPTDRKLSKAQIERLDALGFS